MSILLLNAGSSSIKYQLIDAATKQPLAVGIVQRIGQETGSLTHEVGDDEFGTERAFPDHTAAVQAVVEAFAEHGPSLDGVQAVGHRTVHGGQTFRESVRITDEVIAKLVELSDLAPLHNPPGIAGIEAAMKVLPDVPHVGIFDTAFFADLPAEAYTYAIDRHLARQHQIRKYGFHGTSHRYVSAKAAEYLGKDPSEVKVIVCHLGNGASISAVKYGAPIDTSMGLTPLQGLVMGTRSGDVDPGLHTYLGGKGMSLDEIDTLLNKQSGMGGLCDRTDMRDVAAAIEAGDEDARLAMDVYVHRLAFYIGGYFTLLGGADAVVFTAGVGENDSGVRREVAYRLAGLGVELDEDANDVRAKHPRAISTDDSRVKLLVIPTNEELAMAIDTLKVIGAQ
ncbi:MAG: acetate/propionate family kinase [Arachnia sp.]